MYGIHFELYVYMYIHLIKIVSDTETKEKS